MLPIEWMDIFTVVQISSWHLYPGIQYSLCLVRKYDLVESGANEDRAKRDPKLQYCKICMTNSKSQSKIILDIDINQMQNSQFKIILDIDIN